MTPLASRGMALREQELSMREEIAYGRQELESYKAARAAKQQELKIIQELRKEKQVAAATAAVGKLDPQSPTWLQDYAKVMADHPYAHDDKPLTDLFHEQAKVNNAYLSAQIHREATDYTSQTRRSDETFKAGLDIETDKQKRKSGESERLHNDLVAKAIRDGVDVSKFTTFDENGDPQNTQWAALSQAASQAKASVPPVGIIERAAKIQGDLKSSAGKEAVSKMLEGNIKPEDDATIKELKKQQGETYKHQFEQQGLNAEKASLKAAYPSLFPEENPPSNVAKDIMAAGQETAQKPAAAAPAAQPAAPAPTATPAPTAEPTASPSPAPTPFNIKKLWED